MHKLLFGTATYIIEGFDVDKLINGICKICKVYSIFTENESLNVTVSFKDKEKLCSYLCDKGCVISLLSETGLLRVIQKYKLRAGIAVGTILSLVLCIFLSNIVMHTRVIFSDNYDEKLSDDIVSVLRDNGVYSGAYIPSVNFRELESIVYSMFDDISWVSIGHEGSVVTVNVSIASIKDSNRREHYPSNIVAARDGIIVDARVLAGQLEVLLGSAVSEGEILVNGISESRNGNVYYYHSIAEITAEFDEEYVFKQEYIDVSTVIGDTKTVHALGFFDFIIPFGIAPKGDYSIDISYKDAKIFGATLPFKIITYTYSKQYDDIVYYTYESAMEEINRRISILEDELLNEYKILDRLIIEESDDSGVSLTVKYKLRGEIGIQQRIFAK